MKTKRNKQERDKREKERQILKQRHFQQTSQPTTTLNVYTVVYILAIVLVLCKKRFYLFPTVTQWVESSRV